MRVVNGASLKDKNICELTVSDEAICKIKEKLFSFADFIFVIKDYPEMVIDSIMIDDRLHGTEKDNVSFSAKGNVEYTKFCEKILKMIEHRDGNCIGVTALRGTYQNIPITIMFNPNFKYEGYLTIALSDYSKQKEVQELAEKILEQVKGKN